MSGGEQNSLSLLSLPPDLQVVLLDNNLLTELPDSLAGLSRLEVLTHSGNILGSPPASVLSSTVQDILAWLGQSLTLPLPSAHNSALFPAQNRREEGEEMKSIPPPGRVLRQQAQLSSQRRRPRRSVLRGNAESKEAEEEEELDIEEDSNVHWTER